jgi:membrane fusion protein, multidrug efflux system
MLPCRQSRREAAHATRITQTYGLAVLVACCVGCEKPKDQVARTLPEVTVSVPVQRSVVDYEEFSGTTEAPKKVDIRAQVTGYLSKIGFVDGADVKKGQVLFEIDPRLYEAAWHNAQGQVALYEAKAVPLKSEAERAKKLAPQQAISASDYDKIMGDAAANDASLLSAKAATDQAKTNLDHTTIRSEIDGRVSKAFITEGNLVTANTTLLTTVVSVDPMYAYFDVAENKLLQLQERVREGTLKIRDGDKVPVEMGLGNGTEYPLRGAIDFADNVVNKGTGTIHLRGVFDNPVPPRGDRLLMPGLFVRLRVPIGPPHQAVLVAEQALGSDQGQRYVYVVDDKNAVQYRRVIIGKMEDGLRVIRSGLEPGEQVVVAGLQRVRPGVTVAPKRVDMQTFAIPEVNAEVKPAEKPEQKSKGPSPKPEINPNNEAAKSKTDTIDELPRSEPKP